MTGSGNHDSLPWLPGLAPGQPRQGRLRRRSAGAARPL